MYGIVLMGDNVLRNHKKLYLYSVADDMGLAIWIWLTLTLFFMKVMVQEEIYLLKLIKHNEKQKKYI